MDTLDAIFTRRSIRKFKPDTVQQKDVELLLKAAMYAPTANNTQSCQFIVIDNRLMLDAFTKVHPYAQMLKEAPLAIVVCGDKTLEKEDFYLSINGSAATQNILLAAHNLGLGSVWLGIFGRLDRMTAISGFFNLPKNIIPISAIAIGYPNEEKTTENRYNESKIHFNKWESNQL